MLVTHYSILQVVSNNQLTDVRSDYVASGNQTKTKKIGSLYSVSHPEFRNEGK